MVSQEANSEDERPIKKSELKNTNRDWTLSNDFNNEVNKELEKVNETGKPSTYKYISNFKKGESS